MEKTKKKLTISGKQKRTFTNPIDFQSKKKFSKPINKPSGNFRKNFKSKPQPLKLSDYEKRKLAEQKAMKGIRGDNIQKDKENKSKFSTKKERLN